MHYFTEIMDSVDNNLWWFTPDEQPWKKNCCLHAAQHEIN